MDIVYSSTESIGMRKTTTINGNDCYEMPPMEHECPVRYVLTPRSTMYMALKYNNAIHIVNLKNDGIFPDEFKQHIATIKGKLDAFVDPKTTLSDYRKLWRDVNDNSYNFAIVYKSPIYRDRCATSIPLTNAKKHVAHLNEIMQPHCPGFHLMIDYITSFPENSTVALYDDLDTNVYLQPSIVLCLFTGNHCVSSITMNIDADELSIDSKSDDQYEGRKFNKLLRAVAIIISKSISESVRVVESFAINWISAFLMIKYFNAVPVKQGVNITKDTENLREVIKTYFDNNVSMAIRVELNEANIANATAVFHETIQIMDCGPLSGGLKRTRKSNKQRKIRRTRKTRKTRRTMKTMKTRKTID
jgi:hypothetical protein